MIGATRSALWIFDGRTRVECDGDTRHIRHLDRLEANRLGRYPEIGQGRFGCFRPSFGECSEAFGGNLLCGHVPFKQRGVFRVENSFLACCARPKSSDDAASREEAPALDVGELFTGSRLLNDSSPGRAGGFGKCEPLKAAVTGPLRGPLNPLKGDRVYSNPS